MSHDKLAEYVQVLNAKGAAFLVELGDFKDQDKVPDEARTLKSLEVRVWGYRRAETRAFKARR